MLKKFSQEKDEEGRKLEYNNRKQSRNKDPRKYYTDKLRLWIQAYAPAKRTLSEFKTAIILGLYHMELRKTCLQFMPKDLQYEHQIKAVPDFHLINQRTINSDLRALSHDMAGLKNLFVFENKGKNTRTDEIWRTGQVPMKVNMMPGLVSDESDMEDIYEDVNAMQSENSCFFCRISRHTRVQ